VACWTSELGGLNKFVHVWVYKDLNERNRIRAESLEGSALATADAGVASAPRKQAARAGGLLTADDQALPTVLKTSGRDGLSRPNSLKSLEY